MSQGIRAISESGVAELKPLGAEAASRGGVTSTAEMRADAAEHGARLSSPEKCALDQPLREFLLAIPYDFARRHLLLGLEGSADGPARLAVGSTTSPIAVFNVGVAMKRACASEHVDDVALAEAIDRAYAGATRNRDHVSAQEQDDELAQPSSDPSTPLTTLLEGDAACLTSDAIDRELTRSLDESRRDADLLDTSGKAAVVRLVDLVLFEAIRRGASDVHIQPIQGRVLVRYRMDGVLHTVREMAAGSSLALAIITRIKVIARLDVAERRAPQDGRAAVTLGTTGRRVDLRVSTLPSTYGERVVIRLLDPERSARTLSFAALGMPPELERRYLQIASRASGTLLSTGPTGSGKTTTLYAAINHLNSINTSIITAEDPVEYVIAGISQCSINPKISVTYEETLRHIVRQDPDIIVIGEIRDRFSADTAIQAALTGHKVITTFHTEDSIGGLLRLLHMDIEAFLISSTVVSVLAQRLLRRVCPHCRQDHVLSPDEVRRLGFAPKEVGRLVFARGRGCADCRYTGYKGRLAVFELLILNEQVKEALIQRRTSYEIRSISVESTGLVSLLEDGIHKACDGQTSFEEIMRTLPRLARPRPLQELNRLQGVLR